MESRGREMERYLAFRFLLSVALGVLLSKKYSLELQNVKKLMLMLLTLVLLERLVEKESYGLVMERRVLQQVAVE